MDLFSAAGLTDGQGENHWLDDYVAVRVDAAACPPDLAEDLRGILAARWLSEVLRHDFEQACYGARVFGPNGAFEGVAAEAMPGHWRKTGETGGVPVWQPDGRHPLGKWLADMAGRLLPLPPLDLLDAVLRRHGIEGSRDRAPTMLECEGGFALRVHKPKPKTFDVPGVTADPSLAALWGKD